MDSWCTMIFPSRSVSHFLDHTVPNCPETSQTKTSCFDLLLFLSCATDRCDLAPLLFAGDSIFGSDLCGTHFIGVRPPRETWCSLTIMDALSDDEQVDDEVTNNRQLLSGDTTSPSSEKSPYSNPDYILDPCRYLRTPFLSCLTMEECDMCRRLLCSVLLGGIIG